MKSAAEEATRRAPLFVPLALSAVDKKAPPLVRTDGMEFTPDDHAILIIDNRPAVQTRIAGAFFRDTGCQAAMAINMETPLVPDVFTYDKDQLDDAQENVIKYRNNSTDRLGVVVTVTDSAMWREKAIVAWLYNCRALDLSVAFCVEPVTKEFDKALRPELRSQYDCITFGSKPFPDGPSPRGSWLYALKIAKGYLDKVTPKDIPTEMREDEVVLYKNGATAPEVCKPDALDSSPLPLAFYDAARRFAKDDGGLSQTSVAPGFLHPFLLLFAWRV